MRINQAYFSLTDLTQAHSIKGQTLRHVFKKLIINVLNNRNRKKMSEPEQNMFGFGQKGSAGNIFT